MPLLGCQRVVPEGDLSKALASLERPNVVLIVVDTLRADRPHSSRGGYGRFTRIRDAEEEVSAGSLDHRRPRAPGDHPGV